MARSYRVKCEHSNKDFVNGFELNALRKSITAFEKLKPTSKHKRETLTFNQAMLATPLKPLIKRYMKAHKILALELDLKTLRCLTLEPIQNWEKDLHVRMWLEGELKTSDFQEKLKKKWQWVEYLSFSDFLRGVEAWLNPEKE